MDTGKAGSDTNIQVFIRIRPPCNEEPSYSRVLEVNSGGSQIVIKHGDAPRTFSFDHVADVDARQETIFNKLGKKVIDNCIAGYNGTIFAYGQTGSGKTFTMMGPSEDTDNFGDELRGVIPRSFEYLFASIKREKELHGDSKQFLCKCSFLEIYNEQIFDLLEPSPQVLHLRESLKMGVYVAGLAEQIVVDASEAYQLLSSSWMNRRVASTSMNRESSRSHAVFTLIIESKEMKGGSEHIKTSQLNLVDLAGSESQKNTNATGMRLKEAGSINKSLSNLGNVIMCLVCISKDGNERRHVPYRDSKLTFLLRSSLGGNSKTSLIACVHSGHKYYAETISTLQFAKRAKMIKNKAVLNENAQVNIQHLQMEVKRLKEELSQYKSGAVMPMVPSEAQSPQPAPEPTPELKVMFLRAMNFYQQAQMEKMEIENDLKEHKRIADKNLRQKVMIIKFREDAIKRHIEKAKGTDCEDETVQSLQEEIKALREENAHHPLVAKYSSELQKLRIEIKNMKSSQEWLEKIEQRDKIGEALEKRYKELVTEQKVEDNEPLTTPSRTDSISTATIDKLRSENRDLVEEVKMLKQSLSDSTEDHEEKVKTLKNQLEYSKSTIEEFEAIIGANETRNKIEMAQMTEKHLQTINTITTPKKEKGGRLDVESPLNSSMYAQMIEQQSHNSDLELQLGELGKQNRLKENTIKMLETSLTQMEEQVEKEKLKEGSARQALTELESKMALNKEQMDRDHEEINDLRMVLKSADKELKDVKQKFKLEESLRLTENEKFNTQLEKLERSLEQLKKDKDAEYEIKEELKNELDIQKDNATFHVSLTLQLEEKLNEKKAEIEVLQSRLQLVEEQLFEERTHHENRSNQLSSEGMMKEQLYLDQCSENAKLKSEISDLRAQVNKHLEAEEQSSRLYKQAVEKINQQFCRIQEEADKNADLQQNIYSLTEHLDKAKLTVNENQSRITKLLNEAKETAELNMNEKNKDKTKIDMLEEDLASSQDKNLLYINEVDGLTERNAILKEEADLLRQELDDFKQMKETSNLDLSCMQEIEFENPSSMIKKLTDVILSKKEQIKALKSTLEELEKEKDRASSQAKDLSFENQELKESLEKKNESLEESKKVVEQAESNMQSLRLDYDQQAKELTEATEKLEEWKHVVDEKEVLLRDVTRLKELVTKENEEKRNIQEQLELEKNELKKIHGLFEDEQDPDFTDIQYIHNRIEVLKAEYEKVLVENKSLGGHSNHKQKIKYHEQVKNENIHLKKELAVLEGKNRHLQDQLLKREKSKPDPLCPMKENTKPEHKLFFSGDFTSKRK